MSQDPTRCYSCRLVYLHALKAALQFSQQIIFGRSRYFSNDKVKESVHILETNNLVRTL